MDGLDVLRSISFDWVMRLDDVWREQRFHVPELNASLREDILARCRQVARDPRPSSPLGWVVLGPAGAGKTHMLGSLRRDASSMALFVLVDLTDVKDFWEALLVGYLSSLREPEEAPQAGRLLEDILRLLGQSQTKAQKGVAALAKANLANLVKHTGKIVNALGSKYRRGVIQHQDVLRALILLNSDDFSIGSLGYNYLQGFGLEQGEAAKVGIRAPHLEPIKILRGLSWVMSLRGPTILALDQLDAIVREQHVISASGGGAMTEEQQAARGIIEGLGLGLAALADHTSRTLTLVTCLESTWDILRRNVLHSITDRYESPKILRPLSGADTVGRLIAGRMSPAFSENGFQAPYPTWPFKPEAIEAAAGLTPREVLKLCESHRRQCLDADEVLELASFGDIDPAKRIGVERDDFKAMDNTFQSAREKSRLSEILAEDKEDDLGRLLQTACRCLIREVALPQEVDMLLETRFGGGQNYAPLHARLRLIYVDRGADEAHICFRALLKKHHTSFQARLKAAMTFAGIDKRLSFRKLFVIRREDVPTGLKTKRTIQTFRDAGGSFIDLSDDDLRTLMALSELDTQPPPKFDEWLRERRPVSKMEWIREALPELYEFGAFEGPPVGLQTGEDRIETPVAPTTPSAAPRDDEEERAEPDWTITIPLGRSLDESAALKPVFLPLAALSRHAVVMAGSEAGRTVLVKRLVETAALNQLPSIVIDSTGDMAMLGDVWPQPPRTWPGGEAANASNYHQKTGVMIWTPGLDSGRTLSLDYLPNFAAHSREDDPDTLEDLVTLTASNLQDITATGWSGKSKKKMSVLVEALKYFSEQGGGTMGDFIQLLGHLPQETADRVRGASKLAQEMSDYLKDKVQSDPVFRDDAPGVDPALLFGLVDESELTRISVISLIGLPDLESRQQFVGRLATRLFSWIRKNPAKGPAGLTGLLVIDEAKDFLPSAGPSASKEALLRLAAQGEKYGLGLVLGTQSPKDLDFDALGEFSTWFLGMANAPQSIKLIRKVLAEKGGDAKELANLVPGRFFAASKGHIHPPAKIAVPMCLSHHPDSPPTREEVILRAEMEPGPREAPEPIRVGTGNVDRVN